jgi:uncharacterized protein YbjT (DUF2867 family)
MAMVLVTGARGNIGRHVVEGLARRGLPGRAVSRTIDQARVPPGVEVVPTDLSNPADVDRAMARVEKVFLVMPPIGPLPIAENVVDSARRAGVAYIVMITTISIEWVERLKYAQELSACEDLVRESGIAWTFIRPGEFMSNVLRWIPRIRAEGKVYAAYGNHATAPIDPADIAAVAVLALTEPGHEGQVYTLTGPEHITPEEQTQIIAELLNRPLRFEQATTIEESVAALVERGMEEARAREHVGVFRGPDLPHSHPRPTLELLLGRPGGTFRGWAERHVEQLH